MPQSIAPGFIRLEYISAAAPHVAILPTRTWSPPAGGFTMGSFPRWSDNNARDADDMVKDLVNVLKAVMSTTTTFSRYTIFTQDNPESLPVPRIAANLGISGTDTSQTWEVAVQLTFNFRTANFGRAKLVLLDVPSQNSFGKVTEINANPNYQAIAIEYMSPDNAWSGRDNYRPATFVSATKTLNEKLRKAYRLG